MRKGSAKKRFIESDPIFNDVIVTKFINSIMKDGKKSIAEKIFYNAMELIEKRTGESGVEVWRRAIANVSPAVEVKSRRVGGSTFQVPTEVNPSRKQALAFRWLLLYTRKRGEKTMMEKLAGEVIAASKNEGSTVKKKDDTYRMAEANKAFSHFRF
jgi:small subunit ribosomal protein S7